MKFLFILFTVLYCCSNLAQKSKICEIILDQSLLKSTNSKKNFQWIINGERFDNTKASFKIKSNFPFADTILCSSYNLSKFDTIITRFRPMNVYYFKIGCCNEGFDVLSKNEYEQMQQSTFDDEKRIEFVTQTKLSLTILGLPQNDTIVCYYGDNFGVNSNENNYITANNTKHTLKIDKNGDTNLITHFAITNGSGEIVFMNCYFRFFDKEKIHITYNLISNKLTIQFN